MSSNLADLPLDTRSTTPQSDIYWSRSVQIWQIYPPVLTSSGQDEFNLADLPPSTTSSGQDEFKFGIYPPWY